MYGIFKDDEYFGVCYDNLFMAIHVARIFTSTLGCGFTVKPIRLQIASVSC